MNAIAQAIYIARLQKGFSQKELAEKSGVPQPNISQIEKGRDFKVSTLCQLAMALEISIEDLVRGPEPMMVDKHKFFERAHIEKVVKSLLCGKILSGKLKPMTELLNGVLGKKKGYLSKKKQHLYWSDLRRSFTKDEIDSLISRIEKAQQRLT